jgi:hypothetical protein
VVLDYWVDHCEYILLIDLRIVFSEHFFRSVLVFIAGFHIGLFCQNSSWFHQSCKADRVTQQATEILIVFLDFDLVRVKESTLGKVQSDPTWVEEKRFVFGRPRLGSLATDRSR